MFRFNSEDLNQDAIPDQQELLLTVLIGKRIDSDSSITSLKSVGINFTRTLKALPNDNASLVSEQFASHYSLIRLRKLGTVTLTMLEVFKTFSLRIDTGIALDWSRGTSRLGGCRYRRFRFNWQIKIWIRFRLRGRHRW